MNQRILLVPALPIIIIVTAEMSIFVLRWWIDSRLPAAAAEADAFFDKPIRLGLIVLAFLSGVSRSTAYHPANHGSYRRWLATSPWEPSMPLPLGPITLAWQDAAFLIGLTFFTFLIAPPEMLLVPVNVFLGVYVLATLIVLLSTKQNGAAIIICYGLAGLIQLLDWPAYMLAGLLVLYAIEHGALLRSLWSFPWEGRSHDRSEIKVGWPFDELAAEHSEPDASPTKRNLIACTLVGVWAYSFALLLERVDPAHGLEKWQAFSIVFVIVLPLVRLAIYTGRYTGPINFWGRLWTLNWIIPKYDRVFIGPLWTFISGMILVGCLWLAKIDEPLKVAICFAVPLLVSMSVGPSLHDWKLTGAHHIRRNATSNQSSKRKSRRPFELTVATE